MTLQSLLLHVLKQRQVFKGFNKSTLDNVKHKAQNSSNSVDFGMVLHALLVGFPVSLLLFSQAVADA